MDSVILYHPKSRLKIQQVCMLAYGVISILKLYSANKNKFFRSISTHHNFIITIIRRNLANSVISSYSIIFKGTSYKASYYREIKYLKDHIF